MSCSDLLLSFATVQWDKLDAREEINGLADELHRIVREFVMWGVFHHLIQLYMLQTECEYKQDVQKRGTGKLIAGLLLQSLQSRLTTTRSWL